MIDLGTRRGRRLRVTAVDRDPSAASAAARFAAGRPEVRVVRADAEDLPFEDRSFDLVTASMFLHHFDHDGVVALLRRFRRLARRAVVVNDLRRHRLPWAFIATVARVTRRDPMFRHDAPLSVLRGFTDDELLAAAREAGVASPSLQRRWPFRLVMTLPAESAA
jgi:ubiquinone/menaquinone biosynthesis C-methylase UbiE